MTTIYKCDFCGREFKTKRECETCETSHMAYKDAVKYTIMGYEGEPCGYCEHSYYVYGVERSCKYGECQRDNNYRDFTLMDPLHDKTGRGCSMLQ